MNFSEFKHLLSSDPANPDPEYQAARRSDPEFVQAAAASDEFEQRLKWATQVPVPTEWSDSLKALAVENPLRGLNLFYRYRYAMAATVILALSAAVMVQQLRPRESVEAYVAHHFGVDGSELLRLADTSDADELAAILADFELQMSPELASQVRFVKLCPTPEGTGIHLVLNTEEGPVTVIFMPGLEVQEGERFTFNDMAAELLNVPGLDMSAAIIAQPAQLNASRQGALDETPGATLGATLGIALQEGVWRETTGA